MTSKRSTPTYEPRHQADLADGTIVSMIGFIAEAKGLSVVGFARLTGLTRPTARKLMEGRFDSIHLDTLVRVSEALHRPFSDLLVYKSK